MLRQALLASFALVVFSLPREQTKRDTGSVLVQRYGDFKSECFPRPSGGCNCNMKDAAGVESVQSFYTDSDCKVPIEEIMETALKKEKVNEEIKRKYGDFKENCFPRPSGGCRCNEKDANGNEVVHSYDAVADCRNPLPLSIAVTTVQRKQEVNEEIKHKFGDLKENCFPKPSGGCRCNEKDAEGNEVVANYNSEVECKVQVATSIEVHTAENKKKLNEEIHQKYGDFKENCFPKPSGGCSCNEKDAAGNEVVAKYNSDAECKLPKRSKRGSVRRPSQNVRDPVRERAQANYAAVVNELNEKFRGLKEGCFPRPRGCLCVIGKDKDGRDLTERRMKDKDCKCQPGERGKGCPLGGA